MSRHDADPKSDNGGYFPDVKGLSEIEMPRRPEKTGHFQTCENSPALPSRNRMSVSGEALGSGVVVVTVLMPATATARAGAFFGRSERRDKWEHQQAHGPRGGQSYENQGDDGLSVHNSPYGPPRAPAAFHNLPARNRRYQPMAMAPLNATHAPIYARMVI